MPAKDVVMTINKPHFVVRLHKTLLEVDLKEGIKKELEDALESSPKVRTVLGFLFQSIVPLDVPLRKIESVKVTKKGEVKIVIPSRKDVIIPLTPKESRRLVEKLDELIQVEKERAVREMEAEDKMLKELEMHSKTAQAESDTYRSHRPL